MKHARPDYDHIQDPTGHIPADEPVFLLRAGDMNAPGAVRNWAHMAWANGASREGIVQTALDHADAMEAWQKEHGRKVPDLPKKGE